MLAADSHLGYLDRDPVRGGDSFAAFEEVPLGVLRPRRFSRDFDRVLSDQAANFAAGRVNFEDPHAAVALPVFAVHGNHDDPTRDGGVDARAPASSRLHPVLLRKGSTRVALYGLGNVRDERLNRLWQQKRVSFLRPAARPPAPGAARARAPGAPRDGPSPRRAQAEDGATYFSVLVLHQNRDAGRGRNACVHESMIPEWFDLVVWGHEHECLVEPRESAVGTFRVTQPGSGVATALSERARGDLGDSRPLGTPTRACRGRPSSGPRADARGAPGPIASCCGSAGPSSSPPRRDRRARRPAGDGEARPKHCGLLQIRGDEFRLEPLRLTRARPRRRGSSRRLSGAGPRLAALADRTGFGDVRAARLGARFVGDVANPGTVLHVARAAGGGGGAASAAAPAPVEDGELDAVQIEDLVQGHLDADESKLQVLPEDKMNRALEDFVRKAEGGAFEELRRAGGRRRRRPAKPPRASAAEARLGAPAPPAAADEDEDGGEEDEDEDEAAAEAPPKKSAPRAR
ncbi:manganese ion binding protein [Aureococcus anophagefferens]|nr:manganese ion binding protein [Aureococcus anophagefferens]